MLSDFVAKLPDVIEVLRNLELLFFGGGGAIFRFIIYDVLYANHKNSRFG